MRFSRYLARRLAGFSGAAAVVLLLAPSSTSAVPAEPRATSSVLGRIQRECLRAYPPELLSAMASGVAEIPAPVEADPQAQMQFLDRELSLDKGLFYPTLLEEVLPAFEEHVSVDTRFLDLGSGDGRVLFLAAVLGARATGIEYDERLVETSLRALSALGDLVDPERVEVVSGDFFDSSWAGYDVIFYFDQSSFEEERVREKMEREMSPGARLIVGHEQIPFRGLVAEASFPNLKVYRHPGTQDLDSDLEQLKKGQQQILTQLQEIRARIRPVAAAASGAVAGPDVRDRVFELGANPVQGKPTAKVTLVEFTDYQ